MTDIFPEGIKINSIILKKHTCCIWGQRIITITDYGNGFSHNSNYVIILNAFSQHKKWEKSQANIRKVISKVSIISSYTLIEFIAIIINGKYNRKRNRFAE